MISSKQSSEIHPPEKRCECAMLVRILATTMTTFSVLLNSSHAAELQMTPSKQALNINRRVSKHFFWWIYLFLEGFVSNVGRTAGRRAAVGAAEFCSVEEQMGETRQGRMNSGQKEGDSRAWPPTCPPHTSPSLSPPHSLQFLPPPPSVQFVSAHNQFSISTHFCHFLSPSLCSFFFVVFRHPGAFCRNAVQRWSAGTTMYWFWPPQHNRATRFPHCKAQGLRFFF